MKTTMYIIGVIMLLMAGTIGYQANQLNNQENLGSVNITGEYHSTTNTGGAVKTSAGTLGSVIVSGTGSGNVDIVNATTTDGTLRATAATSSLIVASVDLGTVGTFTYDIILTDGVVIDYDAGTTGTTTVTWR